MVAVETQMSMLMVFFICLLVLVVLEPKVIGTILYWTFLAGIAFVGFWALMFWAISL